MGETYFHGGKAGLRVGDLLVPSPPHVNDGCPVCVARAAGRVCTVGEYRAWARLLGATQVLDALAGADDDAPMDPPSAERAVYITTAREYATWYAAVRGHGDLYRVEPCSEPVQSPEDNFPSFTVAAARVVEVVRRNVHLTRRERRHLQRLWAKADARARRPLAVSDSGGANA